ncbi:CBO0543 family protein [Peribacillus deserti]|uniref:CBO0543 family protein n=1 Tax=Peribacillus deserti TaxID=673318 RepID=UPI003625A9B0
MLKIRDRSNYGGILLVIYTSYIEVFDAAKNFRDLSYEHWISSELFTFDWWFLLIISIIPWVIWWKLFDKNRKTTIIMFGLFIALFSVTFEYIGEHIALWWGYKTRLFPVLTFIVPFDLTFLPVVFMLVYQFFNNWRSFLKGMLMLSFGGAFIFEPLLHWMDIYILYTWKYIYSMPIYFFMGLFFKWLVEKIN